MRAAARSYDLLTATTCQRKPVEVRDDQFPHSTNPLVWIDGSYDMVRTQEQLKYGRKSGVDLGPIDYVKYAEAWGAQGMMIKAPEEVVPVMKKAFDMAGPVIVACTSITLTTINCLKWCEAIASSEVDARRRSRAITGPSHRC